MPTYDDVTQTRTCHFAGFVEVPLHTVPYTVSNLGITDGTGWNGCSLWPQYSLVRRNGALLTDIDSYIFAPTFFSHFQKHSGGTSSVSTSGPTFFPPVLHMQRFDSIGAPYGQSLYRYLLPAIYGIDISYDAITPSLFETNIGGIAPVNNVMGANTLDYIVGVLGRTAPTPILMSCSFWTKPTSTVVPRMFALFEEYAELETFGDMRMSFAQTPVFRSAFPAMLESGAKDTSVTWLFGNKTSPAGFNTPRPYKVRLFYDGIGGFMSSAIEAGYDPIYDDPQVEAEKQRSAWRANVRNSRFGWIINVERDRPLKGVTSAAILLARDASHYRILVPRPQDSGAHSIVDAGRFNPGWMIDPHGYVYYANRTTPGAGTFRLLSSQSFQLNLPGFNVPLPEPFPHFCIPQCAPSIHPS